MRHITVVRLARAREKVCGKKRSFMSVEAATKAAQNIESATVYECPICFCWHITTKGYNRIYIMPEELDSALAKKENDVRCELNKKIKEINQENHELKNTICKLKKEINNAKNRNTML